MNTQYKVVVSKVSGVREECIRNASLRKSGNDWIVDVEFSTNNFDWWEVSSTVISQEGADLLMGIGISTEVSWLSSREIKLENVNKG